MAPWLHVKSCLDVTQSDIEDALVAAPSLNDPSPRERVFGLLKRMAEVARPGQGGPKLLIVLAQMALRDWVDGPLLVKLLAVETGTRIEVFTDDGLGLARMGDALLVRVPFTEFAGAVWSKPELILPLALERGGAGGKMLLRTSSNLGGSSLPAPLSALSDEVLLGLSSGALDGPRVPRIMTDPPPQQLMRFVSERPVQRSKPEVLSTSSSTPLHPKALPSQTESLDDDWTD